MIMKTIINHRKTTKLVSLFETKQNKLVFDAECYFFLME